MDLLKYRGEARRGDEVRGEQKGASNPHCRRWVRDTGAFMHGPKPLEDFFHRRKNHAHVNMKNLKAQGEEREGDGQKCQKELTLQIWPKQYAYGAMII